MSQQVLIVTGGSQGIGAAVARQAAQAGYAVALTYVRSGDLADQVVAGIAAAGGRAIAVQAEMADEASVVALFATVDRDLGKVTALVNNAGIPGKVGNIDGITKQVVEEVMAVNVTGVFIATREAVKRMATDLGGPEIGRAHV